MWLIIELCFYAGILIAGILFLFFRTLSTGAILEPPIVTFSETSDFLEASNYHLDLVLSFAAPLVVSGYLLILNNGLNNKCVPMAEANT